MPIATPASTARIQNRWIEMAGSAAKARKNEARESVHTGNPQHPTENAFIFSAAASPPRTQTVGLNPWFRKQSQALEPRISSEMGTENLEYASGPRSASNRYPVPRSPPGCRLPTQFKCCQQPRRL